MISHATEHGSALRTSGDSEALSTSGVKSLPVTDVRNSTTASTTVRHLVWGEMEYQIAMPVSDYV